VKGLSTRAYCAACDVVRDVIMMEFSDARGVLEAWKESLDVFQAYKDIGGLSGGICPECKGTLLETLTDVECPRCKKGVFKLKGSWMS
jgi:hypothetical protein